MIQHHNWSMSELENMLPWERDIYVDKLVEHIKEENNKIEEQNEDIIKGNIFVKIFCFKKSTPFF